MNSKGCTEFLDHVNGLFERIARDSIGPIEEAAAALVEAIKKDAIIHVAGAGGHSQIPAMEMFYRAGGLAGVSIVFGPGLGLFDGQPCLERVAGMGGATMAYHDVRPDDVVIICNYYGMNAATIDLALAAKKRAGTVIGITSTEFSNSTPDDFTARHPTGKNLAEVVDIAIDTYTTADEQVVTVPGASQAVGVASTLTSVLIVQLLVIRVVELCAEAGIDAPVWMCANHPGGDQTNDRWLKKYIPRMRHLYPEGEEYIGD